MLKSGVALSSEDTATANTIDKFNSLKKDKPEEFYDLMILLNQS